MEDKFLQTPNSELQTNRSSSAEISEVFSSIQGEGPFLGVKQIFVRFGRCNMHCHYCDELEKMKEENFKVVSQKDLNDKVFDMEKKEGPHHSVSLTGGEPLFYVSFLEKWMPLLKAQGFKTYLESNGTLPKELARIIDVTDIVAMDLKPSSSTGDRDFTKAHRKFLKIAFEKEVFAKVVITPETKPEDIQTCIEVVADVSAKIPFIFQPLSDPFGINQPALHLIENKLFGMAKNCLQDVRVIPQMHKIWGVR